MLKRPELPDDFQGEFLKAVFGLRAEAYGISHWLVM